jgi:hypothetical protein
MRLFTGLVVGCHAEADGDCQVEPAGGGIKPSSLSEQTYNHEILSGMKTSQAGVPVKVSQGDSRPTLPQHARGWSQTAFTWCPLRKTLGCGLMLPSVLSGTLLLPCMSVCVVRL